MLKNIFYSVLWNKCPRCHKGDVFQVNNPYNLPRFDKMHESCSCCGEKFEKEPGYFFGAMYVSYALMAGWFMVTWAVNSFMVNASTLWYLIFVCATIVLFMPMTFRISRLLWMNFFVPYNKNADNKKVQQQ